MVVWHYVFKISICRHKNNNEQNLSVPARHKMDFGMNTEFKAKLTPKDDKAVYGQSLLMPIDLKEALIVELALMHKYRIITVLPFSKYFVPYLQRGNPTGNYVSLWI